MPRPVRSLVSLPVVLLVMLLVSATGAVLAADDDDDDHVQARRARDAGEIVSLEKILAAVDARFTGQVVEVELERDDGRWEYEVELLTRDGDVLELTFDAATARLLEVEGDDRPAARATP